jgi:hypothetical protein
MHSMVQAAKSVQTDNIVNNIGKIPDSRCCFGEFNIVIHNYLYKYKRSEIHLNRPNLSVSDFRISTIFRQFSTISLICRSSARQRNIAALLCVIVKQRHISKMTTLSCRSQRLLQRKDDFDFFSSCQFLHTHLLVGMVHKGSCTSVCADRHGITIVLSCTCFLPVIHSPTKAQNLHL